MLSRDWAELILSKWSGHVGGPQATVSTVKIKGYNRLWFTTQNDYFISPPTSPASRKSEVPAAASNYEF